MLARFFRRQKEVAFYNSLVGWAALLSFALALLMALGGLPSAQATFFEHGT